MIALHLNRLAMIDPYTPQLFIDNHIIADYVRLGRVFHKASKFGPVVSADLPWENGGVSLSGCVTREVGIFKMWYKTFRIPMPGQVSYVCYAESDDGVNWTKDTLGRHSYGSEHSTNIALRAPAGMALDSCCGSRRCSSAAAGSVSGVE